MKNAYYYIMLIFSAGFLYSQVNPDFGQIDVCPLKLGNVWVYVKSDSSKVKCIITDTNAIIKGNKYYKVVYSDTSVTGYFRLTDTSFFASLIPTDSSEYVFYKNNFYISYHWRYGGELAKYGVISKYYRDYDYVHFGLQLKVKLIVRDWDFQSWDYIFADEFGLLFGKRNIRSKYSIKLIGCVINGVLFGDTSMSVTDVKAEPHRNKNYYLSQNYPNPFNPTTIINYELKIKNYVSLKVYDLLGNEVATLVNKELPAGSYTAEFSAAGLSSGVYVYTLKAGSYTQSKKMQVIK